MHRDRGSVGAPPLSSQRLAMGMTDLVSAESSGSTHRVLREQRLEPRVVADWVPERAAPQCTGTAPGRSLEQPLDLVERCLGFASLREDFRAVSCHLLPGVGVLAVDNRLL